MGKRVDNIILFSGMVFVLEFKVGEKRHNRFALDQALDYAKDRQSEFLKLLRDENFRFLPGYGEDDSGDWPAELSVFIFNVKRKTAMELGRSFGQNAIVCAEVGKAPELVWCQPV